MTAGAEMTDREKALTDAILDIDAHATGMGEDEFGFVTKGYIVTVGALHRALGVVGHTAVKCRYCDPQAHDCGTVLGATEELARLRRVVDKAIERLHLTPWASDLVDEMQEARR